jgi:hypothetical protein
VCTETRRSFITLDAPQPTQTVLRTAICDLERLSRIPRSADSVQGRNRTRSILSPQVRDVNPQLIRIGRRVEGSRRRIRGGWAFAKEYFGDFTVLPKVVVRPKCGEKLWGPSTLFDDSKAASRTHLFCASPHHLHPRDVDHILDQYPDITVMQPAERFQLLVDLLFERLGLKKSLHSRERCCQRGSDTAMSSMLTLLGLQAGTVPPVRDSFDDKRDTAHWNCRGYDGDKTDRSAQRQSLINHP